MATATELTITTGRTHYGGDPQSNERILSRETRVSVTWRLGEDEQDLTLMTSSLADEAERTLDAACQAAGNSPRARDSQAGQDNPPDNRQEPCGPEGHPPSANTNGFRAGNESGVVSLNGLSRRLAETPPNGSGASTPPTNSRSAPVNGDVPNENGDAPSDSGSSSGSYPNVRETAAPVAAASCASTSRSTRQTRTAGRRQRTATTMRQAVSPGASAMSSSPGGEGCGTAQRITPPQRLAIRALCSRLDVEDLELKLLLDERFGKRELEELSKEEAGALLVALQRGEWEDEAEQPVLAN